MGGAAIVGRCRRKLATRSVRPHLRIRLDDCGARFLVHPVAALVRPDRLLIARSNMKNWLGTLPRDLLRPVTMTDWWLARFILFCRHVRHQLPRLGCWRKTCRSGRLATRMACRRAALYLHPRLEVRPGPIAQSRISHGDGQRAWRQVPKVITTGCSAA